MINEQISALIDGEASELERERALHAMQNDPVLVRTWERYQLVSAVMRRELDYVTSQGLADRILAKLENETPDKLSAFRPGRTLKLASGFAIAASVATVAILNLAPVTGLTTTASTAAGTPGTRVAVSKPLPPEKQRVLNPYLVQHAEFSSAFSVNSMGAYARVVGRDTPAVDMNTAE